MFEDPKLIDKTLQLSLAEETAPDDILNLLSVEMANTHGRDAAWKFFREHFSELRHRAPEFGFSRVVLATSRLCDEKSAKEVEKFFAEHKVEAAEKKVAAAVTSIRSCTDLKKRESVNLTRWLQKRNDAL
jgi:aminopeptidase N